MAKKKNWQKPAQPATIEAPAESPAIVTVKDVCPECGSEHRATHNMVKTDSLTDSNTKPCSNRWHNSKP